MTPPIISAQHAIDAVLAALREQQALVNVNAKLNSGPAIGTALDLSGATRTLNATFEKLPTFPVGKAEPFVAGSPVLPLNDPAFMWRPGYLHSALFKTITQPPYIGKGKPYPAWGWINHELAAYPNADAIRALDLDVITISDGCLNLIAKAAPQKALDTMPDVMTCTHISGAITSWPFAQTHGYFEIECQMDMAPGLWPAFWLLAADDKWPPEIDVFEILGKDPTTMYGSLHHTATDVQKGDQIKATIANPSKAFHTYGVDWDAQLVRWYVDRVLVGVAVTPESMRNRPMYVLANLAVGNPSNWGGGPDATTKFPASIQIKGIRAWKR